MNICLVCVVADPKLNAVQHGFIHVFVQLLLECEVMKCAREGSINPLNTKRRLLYLKTQFVPRSKHFISVVKTNQFML